MKFSTKTNLNVLILSLGSLQNSPN